LLPRAEKIYSKKNRYNKIALFLVHAFDAGRANAHFFTIDSHILQIYLLRAFGSDIGMASALG